MKHQNGTISIGVIIVVALIALIALITIPSYISAANHGNRTEQQLKTKMEDNENVYAQGTQAIMEIAQVPTMYKNDLLEVVKADIQGRYGSEGSKATFQWLKERQLNLDSSMYKAIQQQIIAFRNKFENSQREMLDIRRSYETSLGNFWEGFWLKLAGYPKLDLSKYTIVTTNKARQTFDTKRDEGIQFPGLRPSN